jgi:hypothetical protein
VKAKLLSQYRAPVITDALFVGDWAVGEKDAILELQPASALFFNLEGPIVPPGPLKDLPIKVGPRVFNSSLPAFDGLRFANLSNNHMMDFGEDGLRQTLDDLGEQEVLYAGILENSTPGPSYTICSHEGHTWGVVAISDPQFGQPTENGPGIAPMTPGIYRALDELRGKVDVLAVSFHGGQEEITIPSPNRVALFRSFVDAGADLVWGHHSHVAQVFEQYKEGVIFYGLGNFGVNPEIWTSDLRQLWSLGFRVGLEKDTIQVIPTFFRVEQNRATIIREIDHRDGRSYLSQLGILGGVLRDGFLLEAVWEQIAKKLFEKTLRPGLGWGGWNINIRFRMWLIQVLSFLGLKGPRRFRDVYRYHLIANSAHREVIETALKAEFEPNEWPTNQNKTESLDDYIMR